MYYVIINENRIAEARNLKTGSIINPPIRLTDIENGLYSVTFNNKNSLDSILLYKAEKGQNPAYSYLDIVETFENRGGRHPCTLIHVTDGQDGFYFRYHYIGKDPDTPGGLGLSPLSFVRTESKLITEGSSEHPGLYRAAMNRKMPVIHRDY